MIMDRFGYPWEPMPYLPNFLNMPLTAQYGQSYLNIPQAPIQTRQAPHEKNNLYNLAKVGAQTRQSPNEKNHLHNVPQVVENTRQTPILYGQQNNLYNVPQVDSQPKQIPDEENHQQNLPQFDANAGQTPDLSGQNNLHNVPQVASQSQPKQTPDENNPLHNVPQSANHNSVPQVAAQPKETSDEDENDGAKLRKTPAQYGKNNLHHMPQSDAKARQTPDPYGKNHLHNVPKDAVQQPRQIPDEKNHLHIPQVADKPPHNLVQAPQSNNCESQDHGNNNARTRNFQGFKHRHRPKTAHNAFNKGSQHSIERNKSQVPEWSGAQSNGLQNQQMTGGAAATQVSYPSCRGTESQGYGYPYYGATASQSLGCGYPFCKTTAPHALSFPCQPPTIQHSAEVYYDESSSSLRCKVNVTYSYDIDLGKDLSGSGGSACSETQSEITNAQ